LQRIIIQKAYFIWNETQSWDTTFNQLHILLEYLYDIRAFKLSDKKNFDEMIIRVNLIDFYRFTVRYLQIKQQMRMY
jgi:hypothetical protein